MLYFSCSWDVTTNCCRWNVRLEFLFLHLNTNVHYNRASCQNSGDSVLHRKPQQGTDKLPSEEFRVFIGSACRIINSSHFQFSYANQSPCCFLPCQVLASFMYTSHFTSIYTLLFYQQSEGQNTCSIFFVFSGYTCKLTFTQVLMNTVRFCRIQVIKSMPSPPISI